MTIVKRQITTKQYEKKIKNLELLVKVLRAKLHSYEKEVVSTDLDFYHKDLTTLMLVTSEKTGVSTQRLRLNLKISTEISEYRHIFCHLAKKHIDSVSYGTIGNYLGGRDHSTIMHSFSKHLDLIDIDNEYKKLSDEIEQEFLKRKHSNSESSTKDGEIIEEPSIISE